MNQSFIHGSSVVFLAYENEKVIEVVAMCSYSFIPLPRNLDGITS